MTVAVTLALHRANDVPGQARNFVEQHLVRVSPTVCQDVVLLVSELVTNVVRHGAEPAQLLLTIDDSIVRVDVHDSGLGLPQRPGSVVVNDTDSTGRGLVIVAAIARSWGIDVGRTGENDNAGASAGKTVWFDIAL